MGKVGEVLRTRGEEGVPIRSLRCTCCSQHLIALLSSVLRPLLPARGICQLDLLGGSKGFLPGGVGNAGEGGMSGPGGCADGPWSE